VAYATRTRGCGACASRVRRVRGMNAVTPSRSMARLMSSKVSMWELATSAPRWTPRHRKPARHTVFRPQRRAPRRLRNTWHGCQVLGISSPGSDALGSGRSTTPTCRQRAEMAARGRRLIARVPVSCKTQRFGSRPPVSSLPRRKLADISARAHMSSYVVRHRERHSKRDPRCDGDLAAVPSPEAAGIVLACSV
jgi:hypothetical protein